MSRMDTALWIVIAQRDASMADELLGRGPMDEMHFGPFTSEDRAADLARRVNEGMEGFSASVEGLLPVSTAKAELTAWYEDSKGALA